MPSDRTRRAIIAAALGGGVVGGLASPANRFLDDFAPFSGDAWSGLQRDIEGTVESPYGRATVRYDDKGVPHVDADTETALYYAVGYVHARDRLFQMDVQRRQLRGELSELAGEATVESDLFHRKMDFVGAAEANVDRLEGTDSEPVVDAYVEGVNACIEDEPLPLEFHLVDYEPDPWTVVDTMLMEKSISWALTGRFRELQVANAAETYGTDVAEELYPLRLDHDVPIIRDREREEAAESRPRRAWTSPSTRQTGRTGDRNGSIAPLANWLDSYSTPPGLGSNNWVVSGEHTDSGAPIVANDPHLRLQAPPVWYEQHLDAGEYSVRGAGFPGQPFVVIGRNHHGGWGVTNVHADVLDVYEYETDDSGDRYRYRDGWREFDTEPQTIEVAGSENREITVRKTVHGPYLEREGAEVGVAWTGLTATATVQAIHRYAQHDSFEEFLDATRQFDLPHQNLVYANEDGRTLYYVTGRFPIRRIDGEVVDGDRIFDGSAGEGEWEGFEPYGQSTWEGFVPFEEKPGLIDPDYVATANQTITHESTQYIGPDYASPFRGQRAYELLDERTTTGTVDPAFSERMQLDVLDRRADAFLPAAFDVREECSAGGRVLLKNLEEWDGRMTSDSVGALAFTLLVDAYREIAFTEPLSAADVDRTPIEWTVLTLPADAEWFQQDGVPSKDEALVDAVDRAADRREEIDAETYGEYNALRIPHPFGVDFLGYDSIDTGGSGWTLRNVRSEGPFGASWRMVIPFADGESARSILPGGNNGQYGSPHYDDQLLRWRDGEYTSMALEQVGDRTLEFTEGDR